MKVSNKLKSFLLRPDVQDMINENDFNALYALANRGLTDPRRVGELTEILYKADIDPLQHTDKVPDGFLYGSDITSITIPSHIRIIGEFAFAKTKVEEIIIPDGVSLIKTYATIMCSNLRTLYLPASLASVQAGAFIRNDALRTVVFQGSYSQFADLFFPCAQSASYVQDALHRIFARSHLGPIEVQCQDNTFLLYF